MYKKRDGFEKALFSALICMSFTTIMSGCRLFPNLGASSVAGITASTLNSVRMGQGYNSIGGLAYSDKLGNCVDLNATTSFGDAHGGQVLIYVDVAKSEADLLKLLTKSISLNVSGSASKGTDDSKNPITMASGQIGYSSKSEGSISYKSSAVYVVVRAQKTFAAESMNSYKISEDKIDFFTDRPQRFFDHCGDEFVSGVVKGVAMTGMFQCATNSSEEKQNITRELSGKAGYYSIAATAAVSDMLQSIAKHTTSKCTVFSVGEGGAGTIDQSSPEQYIKSITEYVTNASPENAAAFEYETLPYSVILNKKFHEQVLDKIDLKLENQRSYVAANKSTIQTLKSQISDLSERNQDKPEVIASLQFAIEGARSNIDRCVRDIYDPDSCAAKSNWPISRK